jgi:hypothetical protein
MVGGDNWGIISTGPDAVNIQTVLPRAALVPIAEVAAPAALVSVLQHGGVFVGRDAEIAALADVLDDRLRGAASMGGGDGRADGGRTVVVAAVHGLGGVGKSALAAQYALRQAARRKHRLHLRLGLVPRRQSIPNAGCSCTIMH